MVDFGEIIPDEAVFYDGRTGDEMHNAYALDYTKAYRKLFEKYKGNLDWTIISCCSLSRIALGPLCYLSNRCARDDDAYQRYGCADEY